MNDSLRIKDAVLGRLLVDALAYVVVKIFNVFRYYCFLRLSSYDSKVEVVSSAGDWRGFPSHFFYESVKELLFLELTVRVDFIGTERPACLLRNNISIGLENPLEHFITLATGRFKDPVKEFLSIQKWRFLLTIIAPVINQKISPTEHLYRDICWPYLHTGLVLI